MPGLAGVMPRLSEHDLVSFRVHTHGKVRGLLGCVFRLAENLSALRFDRAAAFKQVANLKSHAGPCALRFAAVVNTNQRIRNADLAHDLVFSDHFAIEDCCVEADSSVHVLGPDDVFNALDFHVRTVIDRSGDAQPVVAVSRILKHGIARRENEARPGLRAFTVAFRARSCRSVFLADGLRDGYFGVSGMSFQNCSAVSAGEPSVASRKEMR